MSFAVTIEVARAELAGVGPLGRRLLAIMAGFAQDDGSNVHPSINRICDDHGMQRRSARKALGQLEKLGFIVNTGRRSRSQVVWQIDLGAVRAVGAAGTPMHGAASTLGAAGTGVPSSTPPLGAAGTLHVGAAGTPNQVSRSCQLIQSDPFVAEVSDAAPADQLELTPPKPDPVALLLAGDPDGTCPKPASASMLKRLAKHPHAADAASFVRRFGQRRCEVTGCAGKRSVEAFTRIQSQNGARRVKAVLGIFDAGGGEPWSAFEPLLELAADGLLGDPGFNGSEGSEYLDIAKHLCRDVEQFERRLGHGRALAAGRPHPMARRGRKAPHQDPGGGLLRGPDNHDEHQNEALTVAPEVSIAAIQAAWGVG